MKFIKTDIAGAFLIQQESFTDNRGSLKRFWCSNQARQANININIVQTHCSYTTYCGTIRGLHYQQVPHAEAKVVNCIRGKVFDIIVDIRPDSSSYKKWYSVVLDYENSLSLFIPEGCAHGFQSLTDNVEMLYHASAFYSPENACGLRWNDSTLNIPWPLPVSLISVKDQNWPDFI